MGPVKKGLQAVEGIPMPPYMQEWQHILMLKLLRKIYLFGAFKGVETASVGMFADEEDPQEVKDSIEDLQLIMANFEEEEKDTN